MWGVGSVYLSFFCAWIPTCPPSTVCGRDGSLSMDCLGTLSGVWPYEGLFLSSPFDYKDTFTLFYFLRLFQLTWTPWISIWILESLYQFLQRSQQEFWWCTKSIDHFGNYCFNSFRSFRPRDGLSIHSRRFSLTCFSDVGSSRGGFVLIL